MISPGGAAPGPPALPQRWRGQAQEVIPSPGQEEPCPGTPEASRARYARPCGQTFAASENPAATEVPGRGDDLSP